MNTEQAAENLPTTSGLPKPECGVISTTTPVPMKTFGDQLKNFRILKELTLRQCSEQIGVDPSNWSKFERGVNPAPKDIAILENWATFFALRGTAKQEFLDAADLSRRELPPDIASDEKVLAALPAFFRAVRGAELDETQLRQFVEDIRALHSPGPRPRK